MDRHELNRMFDGLTPYQRREQELLEKLLQDDTRRIRPMKSWKQVIVAAVAAALLVTTAAAAVVPGLNRRLLEYFGVAPEDTKTVELLAPGAMEVNVTKESNGAALHVTQVYWDRTCVRVLADFTAPEGTVLDMGDFDDPKCWTPKGFISDGPVWPCFMDESGEKLDAQASGTFHWKVLKDDNRQDNRCSMMLVFDTYSERSLLMENAVSLWVPASNLYYHEGGELERETVYTGDWSFEIPLPQKDVGYLWEAGQVVGKLDGVDITLDRVYLSPMTLELTFSREGGVEDLWKNENDEIRQRFYGFPGHYEGAVVLAAKDGEIATLEVGFASGTEDGCMSRYHFGNVTDPAKFQGGTLTLNWDGGKAVIPLDKLSPVDQ